jgi:hypothetical protein
MLKRLHLIATAGVLASACATSTPAAKPAATTGAVPLTPGVANVLNIAGTSSWNAEERLLPQLPILALVNNSDPVSNPAGFSMTCNPDNGTITARLGKQPAARVGQSATYKLKLGKDTRPIEGKFAANPKGGDADFVFPLESVALRTMAQLDQFGFDTDQGEAQWAFVRDPAAQVNARYVASVKNLNTESASYLVFCNPK